jgi:hypothetical protein
VAFKVPFSSIFIQLAFLTELFWSLQATKQESVGFVFTMLWLDRFANEVFLCLLIQIALTKIIVRIKNFISLKYPYNFILHMCLDFLSFFVLILFFQRR